MTYHMASMDGVREDKGNKKSFCLVFEALFGIIFLLFLLTEWQTERLERSSKLALQLAGLALLEVGR